MWVVFPIKPIQDQSDYSESVLLVQWPATHMWQTGQVEPEYCTHVAKLLWDGSVVEQYGIGDSSVVEHYRIKG